ncbi:MAG: hypothetical protein IJ640_09715 [Prevotella sp.]|nr:hypothetical protein [Prevotella sp.]
MKKHEKLAYLKEHYFPLFVKTHEEVWTELSDQQTMFCCCGRLATGLHENNCKKFRDKVEAATIAKLKHLLPNNSKVTQD